MSRCYRVVENATEGGQIRQARERGGPHPPTTAPPPLRTLASPTNATSELPTRAKCRWCALLPTPRACQPQLAAGRAPHPRTRCRAPSPPDNACRPQGSVPRSSAAARWRPRASVAAWCLAAPRSSRVRASRARRGQDISDVVARSPAAESRCSPAAARLPSAVPPRAVSKDMWFKTRCARARARSEHPPLSTLPAAACQSHLNARHSHLAFSASHRLQRGLLRVHPDALHAVYHLQGADAPPRGGLAGLPAHGAWKGRWAVVRLAVSAASSAGPCAAQWRQPSERDQRHGRAARWSVALKSTPARPPRSRNRTAPRAHHPIPPAQHIMHKRWPWTSNCALFDIHCKKEWKAAH